MQWLLCVLTWIRGHPNSTVMVANVTMKREMSFICPQDVNSPVVKVSNHGRQVMSSIPVPLKTRRVGQRCTLNLSRAETSSRWCGVVARRGGCQLRCRPRHLTMVQNTWSVAKSPRVAEQCDVNIN
ncbi:uncharacterized protein TNCV_1674401 [Trichonephila clavipes]|nr:uncharacterized protein TNCV_1674401 [Trichonephila clavipes]